MEDFSDEQNKIIKYKKDCICYACPGSGKTRVLTNRGLDLCQRNISINKEKEKDLGIFIPTYLLTFTKKAANEMLERLYNMSEGNIINKPIYALTMHSLAFMVLTKYTDFEFTTYDDLIIDFLNFLEDKEQSKKFRQNIGNVLVDECQDLNLLQLKIIKELRKSAINLTMVGDLNQSIYEFRGSCVSDIKKWCKTSKIPVLYLDKNFRNPEIVFNLSNYIVKKRKIKKNDVIRKIYLNCCNNEFNFVYKKIKEIYLQNSNENIVILSRTNFYNTLFSNKLQSYLEKCIDISFKNYIEKKLEIMTIHKSKGKEFDNVFIIGLFNGMLPHKKATSLSEERRILYVAITRTIKRVYLTTPRLFFKKITHPCLFLKSFVRYIC